MKKNNLKKLAVLTATALVLTTGMVACGDKKQSDKSTTKEAADDTSSSEVFFTVNGVEVKQGAVWADVKDTLGDEAKPSDTIEPCDGGDYIQIIHYYEGAEITTLRDENIIGISMTTDSKDVDVMGAVKLGDTADAVKSALGTPNQEDESMIVYEIGSSSLMLYMDNGVVNSAMCMQMPQ
ncbi:MAG: hypothetical protein J6P57_08980 [Lachnospiraceae bacterium]|nr:hypothetical protein [Lachnospiraceae bacterium]